jgi:phage internal scaffolding protein
MTTKLKISEMVFRTCYDNKRERVQTCFAEDEGCTHQEQKDDCDINNILEKYRRTGVVNHLNKYGEQYGDFTQIDYQTAQNQVATVNSMFADLPAQERARFNNEPQQFLEFIAQQSNIDDMSDGIIGNNSRNDSELAQDVQGDKTDSPSESKE